MSMVLLDFYSETCQPCKRLMKDLEELSIPGLEIKKLNIMENYELTEQYNVRSVPTLVLLKNNENKASYVGYRGKEDLQNFINNNIQ